MMSFAPSMYQQKSANAGFHNNGSVNKSKSTISTLRKPNVVNSSASSSASSSSSSSTSGTGSGSSSGSTLPQSTVSSNPNSGTIFLYPLNKTNPPHAQHLQHTNHKHGLNHHLHNNQNHNHNHHNNFNSLNGKHVNGNHSSVNTYVHHPNKMVFFARQGETMNLKDRINNHNSVQNKASPMVEKKLPATVLGKTSPSNHTTKSVNGSVNITKHKVIQNHAANNSNNIGLNRRKPQLHGTQPQHPQPPAHFQPQKHHQQQHLHNVKTHQQKNHQLQHQQQQQQQQPQQLLMNLTKQQLDERIKLTTEYLKNLSDAATLIIPSFMYLGGHSAVKNADSLSKQGITHVLNMAQELKLDPHRLAEKKIKLLHIAAKDAKTYNIRSDFDAAFKFIDDCLINKGKIIINCARGISRSATIVIAYLMFRYKMSLNDSFNLIVRLRPQVRPNSNFRRQLQLYEQELMNLKFKKF